MYVYFFSLFLFFFNDPATTEIYTLSLHDALPISRLVRELDPREIESMKRQPGKNMIVFGSGSIVSQDRKSTRLNSSHRCISYAVFCLKKKKKKKTSDIK